MPLTQALERGLTGRLRSKSKAKARRPGSRPEWLDQKRKRGGLTADLILEAELNQMWELACLRWRLLGVTDTPRCLHRRQASSYRKAKPCGAGRCTRSTCGSGLAREGGGSVSSCVTDTPPSRASPLPHLDLSNRYTLAEPRRGAQGWGTDLLVTFGWAGIPGVCQK